MNPGPGKKRSMRWRAKAVRPHRDAFSLIETLECRSLISGSPAVAALSVPSELSAHSVTTAAPARAKSSITSIAMPLSSVRTFQYVLGDLSDPSLVQSLASSNYDMLIVDPTATLKGDSSFNMAAAVAQLKASDPSRVVLAYLNIGEAQDFRMYWASSWKQPQADHPGNPRYILQTDPFGWSGSFPVAYWNSAWQNLFLGSNGIVRRVAKAGFDGVVLDSVGAYTFSQVASAAQKARINAATAMVSFVSRIRSTFRRIDPNGYVVGLNAEDLAHADPAFVSDVDGMAFEDTWFSGTPNSPWGDPAGGDIATDPSLTADRISEYQIFQNAGKAIFTIDYALNDSDVQYAYAQSSALGFVPLVTQVSVAFPTTTTPPELG